MRTGGPPRVVVGTWAVSVALGASAAAASLGEATGSAGTPPGLSPATVISALERMAPDGARGLRVNNLYGSATDSAWQFQAHVTWRDRAGTLRGGAALLPQMAGLEFERSPFGPAKLALEERISATPDAMREVLEEVDAPTDGVQLVEYAPQPGHSGEVVRHCFAPRAGPGTCRNVTHDGHSRPIEALLTVTPGGEAKTVEAVKR